MCSTDFEHVVEEVQDGQLNRCCLKAPSSGCRSTMLPFQLANRSSSDRCSCRKTSRSKSANLASTSPAKLQCNRPSNSADTLDFHRKLASIDHSLSSRPPYLLLHRCSPLQEQKHAIQLVPMPLLTCGHRGRVKMLCRMFPQSTSCHLEVRQCWRRCVGCCVAKKRHPASMMVLKTKKTYL